MVSVTFFRFYESSDKSRFCVARVGQIFRLRDTVLHKKGSKIFLHSEALMWEICFVKDLVNCRYEEISIAVSVEAVRREMQMYLPYGDVPSLPADYSNASES